MSIEIPEYRLVYLALPKAECSTIKQALATVDPSFTEKAAPYESTGTPLLHDVYKTRRFWGPRWEAYDDRWWRFCVVRDPLERMLSCYTDMVVKRHLLRNSRRFRRGLVELTPDPDPDYFFQNLQDYRTAASVIKHHTLPTRKFLGPGIRAFDDIYPIEKISECLAKISALTGVPLKETRRNASTQRLTWKDLAPPTRDALRMQLAHEYADLSRWYENPFA